MDGLGEGEAGFLSCPVPLWRFSSAEDGKYCTPQQPPRLDWKAADTGVRSGRFTCSRGGEIVARRSFNPHNGKDVLFPHIATIPPKTYPSFRFWPEARQSPH